MTDTVQIVYSQEMGSTAFIDDIWSTHYLLLKKESTAFSHDICCCCSPPFRCSPYTAITHEIWSPQYILKRDDVHNNYTREMESTAFIFGRWITQHLFMSEEVHDIYS